MVGVYKITNIINGKYYIGSSKNIDDRWNNHILHLRRNVHNNIHLQRAFDKYGEKNFKFNIVELCDIENLTHREQYHIDNIPKNLKYNIGKHAKGGDNLTNHPFRDDIIRRMGLSIKNRYANFSSEDRIKLSQKVSGEKNPNWKGGISKKYCSCGTRISIVNEKCIKCHDKSGNNNPFFGKKHTQELRDKHSKRMKGTVPGNALKISIEGIVYDSYADASRKISIPVPTIAWRIKSKNNKFSNYNLINQL